MKMTTVEALGGAQGIPSDLIPVRELHAHLIRQSVAGNVVLTDADAKPAAVVMSMERYNALLDELEALRRGN
ncbi:hypothetical protein AN480_29150 (plasmid) [Mycobacterium intracellulare subsp. chimaera]|nr:hypothetical protein [Mycobacterium malmoense]AOS95121.1 hypothetical protein AN480_29150 [Mycobacterium intracellulare subsp. chimaera]OCB49429.1 hypothetical protein A9X02_12440 [Mycobacterium malmoense]